jgi:hypothetical protein
LEWYVEKSFREKSKRGIFFIASNIKQEPSEHKFVQQIHEGLKNIFFFLLHCIFFQATEKAKSFVAQLNEQMKLYPEGYDGTKMSDEQRGQYVEQKEVGHFYFD